MGDFYSHDWMDDDDWLLSAEERERLSAKNKAREEADTLRLKQQVLVVHKKHINENLDKMSPKDLYFMYKMSSQVPELRAFFKVFKDLQKGS